MAKEIIYPTNENEILAGETRYTKTEHGITDWNVWSSYGNLISKLNPLSESELLLFKRKTEYESMKKVQNSLSFIAELSAMQVTKWMESEHKDYFTQAFPIPGTSIYLQRGNLTTGLYSEMIEYFEDHIRGNDSMLHFFNNKGRKLPWLDMKVVDSEVTFNNRDDSYFIHSSIRCGKKMEIYSLIDSEVENVNLHHNKLSMENSKIKNIDFDGDIDLKNSELCDTLISIKSNYYSTTNRMNNIKMLQCQIFSHAAIDYRSEKGLVLKEVIIYDFRTNSEKTELTKEMVINNVIILGK
ncbi:hypothetical protein ABLU29_06540 [Lactococcus lactis]|uniref:hypothetical protein n=1 Tax=Lactococcus lactis TaxID=1358 RepID=UPI003877FC1F